MGGDGLYGGDEAESAAVEATEEEVGLKLTRSFAHSSCALTHAQWRGVLPDSLPAFKRDDGKCGRERMYTSMSGDWALAWA